MITEQEIVVTIRCARTRRSPAVFIPSQDFTTDAVKPQIADQGLRLMRDVEERLAAGA